MIIDAHYHLQEPMEPIDKLLDHMTRYDVSRVALMPALNTPFVIDWLTVISTRPTQKALNNKWQKRVALFVYGSTVTEGGKFRIGKRRYLIYDELDNGSVAQAMQSYPDKFFGWIMVNPNVNDPIVEINKWVGQTGWIGIKTHPFMHRYPIRMLDKVADYCVEKGWPILMHLGTTRERGDFRYLPDRHPQLKIIYAHAGLPYFRTLWEYAKDRNNVFVDLSCSLLDESILLKAVKALGANRCLYGSDSPYGYPEKSGSHDYGRVLNNINLLPISDTEKKQILGDNFREIIGI